MLASCRSGIQRHPAWSKFSQLEAEARKASRTSMDLDRKWAKSQRLIRTLENVVLAANLPKVAGDDVQNQYQQLLAAERAAFGPPAVIAAE